jgi:hypothetical protein
VAPTPAAQKSIVNYLAWRLAVAGVDVIGKTTLTSAGGELSRYPSGRHVRLPEVVGHRDLGLTECPGDALYGLIAHLRGKIQARIEEFGGIGPPDDGGDGGGVGPTTYVPLTPPLPTGTG